MQALIYTFIALMAAGVGALAYFAFAYTPADAVLLGLVATALAIVVTERMLRRRSQQRIEKAIQDLSRLLATDAQAGAVLGQRINALTDVNAKDRLDTLEADISVLGTVIRQVAEAVADLEEKRSSVAPRALPKDDDTFTAPPAEMRSPRADEPVIPPEMLRQALDEGRLVFHIQPVVRLPQRRPVAYDLVPRLRLEDEELALPADFMPRRGAEELVREIDEAALIEAIAISRRSRTGGQPATLNVPMSRATLSHPSASQHLLVTMDANRALADRLNLLIADHDWRALTAQERSVIESLARKGVGVVIAGAQSLRLDIASLAPLGVRAVRVDAGRFLSQPETFTDFHLSDIADYLSRFDVALTATGIDSERQIIELLDNAILHVQGDHIAPPGPIRADLTLETARPQAAQLRRV